MDEYYKGNPFGFIKIYNPDNFTYLDSGTVKRRNSVHEMSEFFEKINGKIIAEKEYIFKDVAIQFTKDAAVISFQMFVRALDFDFEWNVSEIFQKTESADWLVIHSHYSFVRPMDIGFKPGKFPVI